jgi:tyrosyl-tRNA synthetase
VSSLVVPRQSGKFERAQLARLTPARRSSSPDSREGAELAERIDRSLKTKKPLRVKFGMDPSSPDLHVGHAIPLMKLRAIQELGHVIC